MNIAKLWSSLKITINPIPDGCFLDYAVKEWFLGNTRRDHIVKKKKKKDYRDEGVA